MYILKAKLIIDNLSAEFGNDIKEPCIHIGDDYFDKKIKRQEVSNKKCVLENSMNYLLWLQKNVALAIEELIASRKEYANGGHVLDGVALFSDQFQQCIDKLISVLVHIENLLYIFEWIVKRNVNNITVKFTYKLIIM